MDLSRLIERNAAFTPDKPALRFEGAAWSYRMFESRIERMAGALKAELGVSRGDRVGILSLNRPDYLVLLYACARIGAILVPLNWRLAIAEQLFIVADAGVKVMAIEQAFAALIPELTRTLPPISLIGLDFTPEGGVTVEMLLALSRGEWSNRDIDLSCPLLIVYTSGTTGRPKGAVLRQEALLWNGVMSQHMHALTSDDHVLTVLPFFHVGGLNIQTTPALHHGGTVTIYRKFSAAETLSAIAGEGPSLTVLVPATMQAVLEHPHFATTDLGTLRAIATGSQIVPQSLIDGFTSRGIPVLQVYGSTETCPTAIYTRLGSDHSKRGSTGLPGLCCEAAVIDEAGAEVPHGTAGEIVIRGPNVFFEYWSNEAATREALQDGWFRTGDIGTRDADGYFWVHDRKKNMIISGGENIYPAEIERVLLEHADVADVGVVGRPDAKWQEVPVAYIVPKTGCTPDGEALKSHVLSQLARFKVPREMIFVEELPRTALGKVQHFKLKQQHQE